MKKIRVLFIRTDWGVSEFRKEHNAYGGIGYYRTVKPGQALQEAYPDELEVTVWGKEVLANGDTPEKAYPPLFQNYDLVISKEIDGVNASNMVALSRHFGTPLVIDIDDNLMALREDNPAYQYYGLGKEDRYLKFALYGLVDGIIASTEPLKEALLKFNGSVDVLPNCNDIRDWDEPKKVWNDGKIRIGYAGGVSHNADLEMIKPVMLRILKRYPNVRWEILGAYDKAEAIKMLEMFVDVADQIQFFTGTPSWMGYPKSLASMGWDIGLAPLIKDGFNESKSHIKWMEYASLGIPCVASGVYPYKQMIQGVPVIEQEKTGFLVKPATPEYFETYLTKLIESSVLRETIGTQARDAVIKNWQYSSHIRKWKAVIDKYAKVEDDWIDDPSVPDITEVIDKLKLK